MSDDETLERRIRAVERSLTDGNHEVEALRDAGAVVDRLEALESQIADAEARIAELEAATQALRGYVGNVRSVNEDVERRADAALAAVERLEDRTDATTRSRRDDSRSASGTVPTDRSQPQPPARGDRSSERETGDGGDDDTLVARVRDVL